MTTTPTDSALRAAANAFLALREPLAIEPGAGERMLACVRQCAAGTLDARGIRAAFGSPPVQPARSSTPKGVAVVELTGLLTPNESFFTFLGIGTNVRQFTAQLNAAAADASTKAIVVLCDSPGGSVRMIPETARAVRVARGRKPVIVAITGDCASAAYWITSNASSLSATTSAMVGAVGVYGIRASIVRQLDDDGVDVLVTSAGKYKAEGLEVLPITDAEREAKQALVDEAYAQFVSDVATGRGVPPSTVRGGYGEGRIVTASTAQRLGMIDRIELMEVTLASALARPDDVVARARANTDWMQHVEVASLFDVELGGLRRPSSRRADYDEQRMSLALLNL